MRFPNWGEQETGSLTEFVPGDSVELGLGCFALGALAGQVSPERVQVVGECGQPRLVARLLALPFHALLLALPTLLVLEMGNNKAGTARSHRKISSVFCGTPKRGARQV